VDPPLVRLDVDLGAEAWLPSADSDAYGGSDIAIAHALHNMPEAVSEPRRPIGGPAEEPYLRYDVTQST